MAVVEHQQTIAGTATVSGRGLFTGEHATVTFRPAPVNHGVIFIRTDLGNAQIPALVQHVIKKARRTALKKDDASVETCEHCLSAIAALGIDNLIIEIDGPELPGLDGSSKLFLDALMSAGIEKTQTPRRRLVVTEPVVVRQNGAMVAAVPDDDPSMQVVYELEYGDATGIEHQIKTFGLNNGDYATQIAPARTFVLESEAKALQATGIGQHITPEDVLVMGEDGPIGGNELRFPDELVRHKIVDLIGDLYLLGIPIQGRIIACKSGHSLNHALVRKLIKHYNFQRHTDLTSHSKVLDIKKLSRILPHRYPMLLVDRVVEIDSDRRAVGIKNVSINEPFFQGHYPGTPIMPGVLVVEAMAQLSGVLIGQKLEHTGKLAVLLSLDRVKLRRPVTPGDQLILEAESVRIRRRIAHMRCRAYVAEDLAAEAEVKFMLVDNEQE